MKKHVAVVGASGYSGAELIRLLKSHPYFELEEIFAHASAGELLGKVHPQFAGDLTALKRTSDLNINDFDLVFFALPAGISGSIIKGQSFQSKIVDLGADFRLKNPVDWKDYYQSDHFGSWVYGLPELKGAKKLIMTASKIANPGCYASAANLSLIPAVENKIVLNNVLTIVGASGTSGAGRSLKNNLLQSEADNNLSPYRLNGKHQHIPEIKQVVNSLDEKKYEISFIPILAPMPRGILLTVNYHTNSSVNEIKEMYCDYYQNEPFIRILEADEYPNTRATIGSNSVLIGCYKDEKTNQAQIVAAIDNLGKGAASGAIQNANLMFDLDETTGLSKIGIG